MCCWPHEKPVPVLFLGPLAPRLCPGKLVAAVAELHAGPGAILWPQGPLREGGPQAGTGVTGRQFPSL